MSPGPLLALAAAIAIAAIAPPGAQAQGAAASDFGAAHGRHQDPPADAERAFDLLLGVGVTPSLYRNLSDGGHVMAAALWPATARARLRLEGFASFAEWGYLGLEPGEDPETVDPRWINRGIKPLLGLGAFLDLSLDFDPVHPYLFLGPALHYAAWPDDGPRTDFGLAAGAGATFDLLGVEVFLEASLRVFSMAERVTRDAQAVRAITIGLRP